ncbi:MAG: DUF2203 domain-containing protein [Nanoarchaeota archaeon]
MQKRYFSLEEAEQIIPDIRKDLMKLIKLKNSINTLSEVDIEFDDEYVNDRFDTTFNKELHKMSYGFYKIIDKLEKIGCILRDIDIGLIDFLSVHNGKEICLCYRIDENRIAYWHELYDGFEGRRPLKELIKRRR